MSWNSDWNVLVKDWIESWHSVRPNENLTKEKTYERKKNFTRVFCQRTWDMDHLEEVVEEKKGFIIVFREYLRPSEFSSTLETSWTKKWQCFWKFMYLNVRMKIFYVKSEGFFLDFVFFKEKSRNFLNFPHFYRISDFIYVWHMKFSVH